MKYRAELEDFFIVWESKLPISQMAKKIIEEYPEIKLVYSSIKRSLYVLQKENLKISIPVTKENWRVVDKNYIFDNKFGHKTYSIDFINKMFLYYSRNGYDYTGSMMCQEFELAPQNFDEIRRVFMLQKNSDILSPHTIFNSSSEELEILRTAQLDKLLKSGKRAKQKYDQKVIHHYRKVIDSDSLNQQWLDEIYLNLSQELPKIQELVITKNETHKNKAICVVLADLHSGSKSNRSMISEEWSVERLEEKLDRVTKIINSYGSKHVTIYLLGDLVETISGLNHPDTYKLIQSGWFGSQAIIGTYDILRRFIGKIHNLKAIGGCGGNHDRLQASNKNSDTGATDIIFEFLKRYIFDAQIDLQVNYHPVIVTHDFKNFGFIGVHGDKGLHRQNMNYLLHKFAIDKSKFQFIFSAHLHSFFCQRGDDNETARRVTIPSIVTGNDYSDIEIGRGSKSGFIIIKDNMFNEPTMIVENV